MTVTLKDLRQAREHGINANLRWHQGIATRDLLASDIMTTVWPDDVSETGPPVVENIYGESLQDKVYAASSALPNMKVAATRGTKRDEAEQSATKRKRVFLSYWERSAHDDNLETYLMDYLHAGAWFMMPWCDFFDRDGNPIPSEQRYPYQKRMNPRNVFPLAHHSKGRLSQAIIANARSVTDLKQEYGPDHPGLRQLITAARERSGGRRTLDIVEELWFVDETDIAVAFVDPGITQPVQVGFGMGIVPYSRPADGPAMAWAMEPRKHRLIQCPLIEARPKTHDGSYRSPLEGALAPLQVAQNIMSMYLDNFRDIIYSPTVWSNVDTEELGPGAQVEALDPNQQIQKVDGGVAPKIEALNAVRDAIDTARNRIRHIPQRGGDPGASIASDKAVNTLSGSFNAELASAQRAIARGLQGVNVVTANWDEMWCAGSKSIDRIEDNMTLISSPEDPNIVNSYDPAKLFAGDYRNKVTYGAKEGLDENAAILRLSALRQERVLSRRSYGEAFTEDQLQEEREAGLEKILEMAEAGVAQQVFAGNNEGWDALWQAYEEMDGDRTTSRQALMKAFRSIQNPVSADGSGGQPDLAALMGGGGAGSAVTDARARSNGGLARGPAGQELLGLMPPGVQSSMGEILPGGTAS